MLFSVKRDGDRPAGGGFGLAAVLVVVALVGVQEARAGASAVSAGGSYTCAVTTGGGAKCWGNNGLGGLGDGSTTNRSTPVQVSGLESGVAAISAGSQGHTCALTTDGAVKCWGYNGYGGLGDGSTTSSSTPVQVTGLTSGGAAVSAGTYFTCALTTGGAVKCWGYNEYRQLGDGGTTDSSIPVQVTGLASGVAAVAAGGRSACALTTAGAVKCWGNNTYGQLGNNTTTSSSTPVLVSGLGSGVAAIAAGPYFFCARTTGGAVKCWGNNGYGALGNDSTANSSPIPVQVTGLTSGVAVVSAGDSYACAVTTGGAVKCWGGNLSGQLGNNSTTLSRVPVQVTGFTSGAVAVEAGITHACAVTTVGGIKCWGANNFGQLGDGSTDQGLTPVEVLGLSNCGNGVVDAGESCDGGACCASDCALAANGTECRASAGVCDLAETCDGAATTCPADAVASAGVICRGAAGGCDVAESCDGTATACPADAVVSAATECRGAAGECDVAESCDGASVTCPGDGFVADGTACSADGPCATGMCGSGACGPVVVPREDCRVVLEEGAAKLQLKDSAKDARDQFGWDWKKGSATILADLGGPDQVSGAAWELCMWDESGLEPALVLRAEVAPGAGWSSLKSKGYKFSDKNGAQGGITGILAKVGDDGRAAVQVDGKGEGLAMPVLPLGLPTRVQLEVADGVCFEATFSDTGLGKNDSEQFQGLSD